MGQLIGLGGRIGRLVDGTCQFDDRGGSLLQIAGAAIESRGLVLQPQPLSEHLLEQLMTLAPQALLIDPELPGAAKFAFSARGAGYKGLIIGLRPISGGAALKAAFDHICEAQTMTSIQTALFGSG